MIPIVYRGYSLTRTDPQPPIPDRGHDWCATSLTDCDAPCLTAGSLEELRREIDERLDSAR